jgi:periplasmic copper chaperone A
MSLDLALEFRLWLPMAPNTPVTRAIIRTGTAGATRATSGPMRVKSPTDHPVLRVLPAVVAVLGMVTLGACGSESAARNDVDTLTIMDARTRPTSPGVDVAAVYLDVTSPNDDTITAVSTPTDVAAKVTMHQAMTADGDGMGAMPGMDHSTEGDMAAMDALTSVSLSPDTTVSFEPGGMHLIVENLTYPLEDGDTFEITLTFAVAGQRTVTVDVTNDI